MLKAAATAETRAGRSAPRRITRYIEQFAKNGMKVDAGSPQLKADLKKVGDTMIADWAKQAGPDGQAILDAYQTSNVHEGATAAVHFRRSPHAYLAGSTIRRRRLPLPDSS